MPDARYRRVNKSVPLCPCPCGRALVAVCPFPPPSFYVSIFCCHWLLPQTGGPLRQVWAQRGRCLCPPEDPLHRHVTPSWGSLPPPRCGVLRNSCSCCCVMFFVCGRSCCLAVSTGEVQWVRQMMDEYHDAAVRAGVKIVPCCGFDSIPSVRNVYQSRPSYCDNPAMCGR